MKRFSGLILIFAVASIGASVAHAQSGRARRAESPKEERVEKSEAGDQTKDEAQDASKDKARNDGAAQSGDNGEKVWTSKEVTVRAVIKSRPLPVYPRGARPYGAVWQVKLRIILGADGRVRDKIEVLEGARHGLTEEAIKAARRIEFEPAQKDGRPVSQYVTLIYHFNLH